MKRWTRNDEYKWRCEQADLAQGKTKRLDAKKGYYRAENEKPKAEKPKAEKSKGVVLIKKYYKSSISTVFTPTDKPRLSDKDFFKMLYA
nr:MAG TPA: hypothetical protein [Caudoviricetes sp.]